MGKIVNKADFPEIRNEIRKKNQKIILCHGVFDLVHPGHIIHFEEAKKMGDILIVSVTAARCCWKSRLPASLHFYRKQELRH